MNVATLSRRDALLRRPRRRAAGSAEIIIIPGLHPFDYEETRDAILASGYISIPVEIAT